MQIKKAGGRSLPAFPRSLINHNTNGNKRPVNAGCHASVQQYCLNMHQRRSILFDTFHFCLVGMGEKMEGINFHWYAPYTGISGKLTKLRRG